MNEKTGESGTSADVEVEAGEEAEEDRGKLPGYLSPLDPSRRLKVGGHSNSREHVVQVQRDRLIDAIVRLAADEGYEYCGIKPISRHAGVAFNTFYDHFDTREELFLVAYDRGVRVLFGVVTAAFLTEDASWEERLEAGIVRFLSILSDNPAFARFFIIEAVKVGPEAMDRIDKAFDAAHTMFASADPAQDQSTGADEAVPLVIGGIYSRISYYLRSGRADQLPELAPILTEFVLANFRVPDVSDLSDDEVLEPDVMGSGMLKPDVMGSGMLDEDALNVDVLNE